MFNLTENDNKQRIENNFWGLQIKEILLVPAVHSQKVDEITILVEKLARQAEIYSILTLCEVEIYGGE